MKIFSKKITYTDLKDNLSALVLIPTLLGGLWQILELASIGTPYLRFFSISQLISDGLLILLIFVCIYWVLWSVMKEDFRKWISGKKMSESAAPAKGEKIDSKVEIQEAPPIRGGDY